MKMIINTSFMRMASLIALTGCMLVASTGQTPAQTDQDLIDAARSVVQANLQAVVVSTMKLTEAKDKDFWPLYQEYRHEMEKGTDKLTKLVLEYAKVYPDVPADRAKEWLKEYIGLQKKQVNVRTAYLEKFGKILPAAKALRFAQVETRLDLLAHLPLAAQVPLVPIGGDK